MKARLARAALVVLSGLLVLPVRAAEKVYVAPEGNDAAAGTRQAPMKTIAAALRAVDPAGTIVLREGTYPGPVTISTDHVTIQSAHGETAVIRCPNTKDAPYACVVVNGRNVALRDLEIVGGSMHAVDFNAAKNCLLHGCRLHDSGADVVKCSPSSADITIRSCEIYNSGLADGKPSGWHANAEGIDNVRSDNMLVQDCFIHDIATNGAYAKGGARGAVFERCLFLRIGLNKDVQGQGVILGEHAGGTETYENIAGVVRNCVFVDIAGAAFAAWCADRPKFYNNTAVNVARSDRAGIILLANHGRPTREATIVNNIVVIAPGSKRAMIWIYDNGHEGRLTCDHNRYFGGSGQFLDWRKEHKTLDFRQWREALSADANSTFGDPGLDANYHLAKDSPCIGKGLKVPDVTDDYDGARREGAFDIGADQFGVGRLLRIPPPKGIIGTGCGQFAAPTTTKPSATAPAASTTAAK